MFGFVGTRMKRVRFCRSLPIYVVPTYMETKLIHNFTVSYCQRNWNKRVNWVLSRSQSHEIIKNAAVADIQIDVGEADKGPRSLN